MFDHFCHISCHIRNLESSGKNPYSSSAALLGLDDKSTTPEWIVLDFYQCFVMSFGRTILFLASRGMGLWGRGPKPQTSLNIYIGCRMRGVFLLASYFNDKSKCIKAFMSSCIFMLFYFIASYYHYDRR